MSRPDFAKIATDIAVDNEWGGGLILAIRDALESAYAAAHSSAVASAKEETSRGEGQQQWRDIATAPKDGTVVLLLESDGWIATGYMSDSVWWNGKWMNWECRSDGGEMAATHWQPLPAPPPPQEE